MFIFYSFIFLLGLVIGSFLNVVIFRTETNEDIVGGRSHCRKCRKNLAWYDLVPLFSFMALRGKCRNCHKKISIQYPLVELATGILFVLVAWHLGFIRNLDFGTWNFFKINYYWFIVSSLVVIFVYDLKHYIIPDRIVYSAIAVSVVYRLLDIFFGYQNLPWIEDWGIRIFNTPWSPFIAAFFAGGLFLLIVLLTKGEGMGGGDIKLAFLMGLFLGIDKILISLAVAFTLGAIIGIILIILKKKTLKSAIPFGPFLAIGTIIGLFI